MYNKLIKTKGLQNWTESLMENEVEIMWSGTDKLVRAHNPKLAKCFVTHSLKN